MHILHVTDRYLPHLGGIEAHVWALAHQQAARGDEVTVLTSTPADSDHWHLIDDGPVTVHRTGLVSGPLPVDLSAYDVVHAHVSVVSLFAAPVAAVAARRGAATLVTVHSMWGGMGPVPGIMSSLAALRGSPVLWAAVSRVSARQLAAQLPRNARIRVLPNAVSVRPRAATPGERPGGEIRLVSTMRLARRKRPLPLLRLYTQLQAQVSVPVSLTIVGDGPVRSRLERRIAQLGVEDSVRLTGRLEPEAVLDQVAEADIYVAPAVLESFGLAVLEARDLGVPVVGHAASGITEFVRHGHEGLLATDDSDMVTQLRTLVVDGRLRHQISEHNRLISSGLTWSSALEDHDEAYAAVRTLVPGRARSSLRAVTNR